MGRGDNRTKRGKISNGTFGKVRPSKLKKTEEVAAKKTTAKTAKA